MRREIRWLCKVAAAGMFTLTVACNDDEQHDDPPLPQEDGEAEETGVEPDRSYPLTGENIEEKGQTPYRPLAVVISNARDARPLSGLGEADIVYEVLTEGAVTRFVALYHSEQPERIGPVRSAREYFIDIAQGYDAMFIAHGWSPGSERRLQAGEIDHLNGMEEDEPIFIRDAERSAPHNSYISFTDVIEGLKSMGFPIEREIDPLFIEETPLEGEMAADVTITYRDVSTAGYNYDEVDGHYLRTSDGTPMHDAETGEALTADNVLIAEAAHEVVDDEGRRSIELDAGGRALLLQDGEMRELQWENDGGRILPTDGEEIAPLKEGATWINIVPSLDQVTIDS